MCPQQTTSSLWASVSPLYNQCPGPNDFWSQVHRLCRTGQGVLGHQGAREASPVMRTISPPGGRLWVNMNSRMWSAGRRNWKDSRPREAWKETSCRPRLKSPAEAGWSPRWLLPGTGQGPCTELVPLEGGIISGPAPIGSAVWFLLMYQTFSELHSVQALGTLGRSTRGPCPAMNSTLSSR